MKLGRRADVGAGPERVWGAALGGGLSPKPSPASFLQSPGFFFLQSYGRID